MAVSVDSTASTAAECPPPAEHQDAAEIREALAPGESAALFKNIVLTAVWLALMTGGVEGLYWLLRQQIGDEMVFIHPGFLWLSPLAQLALLLPLGVALAAVAGYARSPGGLPFAVTLLSLLAWLNLLQLFVPGLHFWAWILLGCGLATATGRLFQRHTARCVWVIRRTTAVLLVLLAAVAVAQFVLAWQREQRAVAALPPSPRRAPNVLLVVLDTVRADALNLGAPDNDLAPNLARLAQQGTVFRAASATAPWTLPSQAGMFTGRLPHELSCDWMSPLEPRHPTLAEELSARGWLTGGFVGNTRYCSAETGLARGFAHYEGYRLSWADVALCTALGRKLVLSDLPVHLGWCDWPGRKHGEEINERLLHWLGRYRDRPFFAFVNYWDAHDPYFAPPGFSTAVPSERRQTLLLRSWWWVQKEDISESDRRMLRGAYEDCVRGLDDRLGRLFDELRRRGELENTLVVVTADHGEHFAEHDLYLHGNSLYQPLLHVPLLVIWPGKVPAGRCVDTPVSLRGLPNTVCELLNLEHSFPGESWVRCWTDSPDDVVSPQPVIAEIASQADCPPCHGRSPVAAGAMRCVRLQDTKYIRNGDGAEELYDLAADPDERTNLVEDPQRAEDLRRMRELLPAEPFVGIRRVGPAYARLKAEPPPAQGE